MGLRLIFGICVLENLLSLEVWSLESGLCSVNKGLTLESAKAGNISDFNNGKKVSVYTFFFLNVTRSCASRMDCVVRLFCSFLFRQSLLSDSHIMAPQPHTFWRDTGISNQIRLIPIDGRFGDRDCVIDISSAVRHRNSGICVEHHSFSKFNRTPPEVRSAISIPSILKGGPFINRNMIFTKWETIEHGGVQQGTNRCKSKISQSSGV
jgi:hypothetical protein